MDNGILSQLSNLLRDYGYKFSDGMIIELGIPGYTSSRIMCNARDIFDAAEILRPIIRDDEFSNRHMKICPY